MALRHLLRLPTKRLNVPYQQIQVSGNLAAQRGNAPHLRARRIVGEAKIDTGHFHDAVEGKFKRRGDSLQCLDLWKRFAAIPGS